LHKPRLVFHSDLWNRVPTSYYIQFTYQSQGQFHTRHVSKSDCVIIDGHCEIILG
jgi:hypothetical protein